MSTPQPLTPDPPPFARIQRRTLVVLVVAQVVGTIGVGVAPSIGILLAGEVTDNEALAGLARTTSTLGTALFGLFLGTLAANRGRRVALAGGWGAAALGGVLLVVAAQWSLIAPMVVGLLLIGAGSAVSLQARFAATDLADPARKGRSLATVVWVGTLGSVLGPNLGVPGEVVSAATGLTVFASAFLIAAACLALAGLLTFALLRPDPLLLLARSLPADQRPDPTDGRPRLGRMHLRDNPTARFAVLAIITAQAVMVAIMTMTPVHIVHQGGSVAIVGITISLHIVGMYALAPAVGVLTDRLGARPTIAMGIAVFVASLVIGAAIPHDTTWIIVALVLLGVGWSFVNVAGSALFAGAVPPDTRAASQGGVDALSNLAGATAALVAGPLLIWTGFSVLSVLSLGLLIPLAWQTARRPGRGANLRHASEPDPQPFAPEEP